MESLVDIEQSLYWLQSICYQGKRLLDSYQINGYLTHTITRMEEHFFLVACQKATRWINKLQAQNILSEEIRIFKEKVSVKLVRDKREHDDEYQGTNAKDEKLSDVSNPNSELTIKVGQSITMKRNSRYYIGGTLDVHTTMEIVNQLFKPLKEIQHAYWEKRGAPHFKIPDVLISK